MYVFNISQYLGENFESPPLDNRYFHQYLGAFDQYCINIPNQYLGDFNQYDGTPLVMTRLLKTRPGVADFFKSPRARVRVSRSVSRGPRVTS